MGGIIYNTEEIKNYFSLFNKNNLSLVNLNNENMKFNVNEAKEISSNIINYYNGDNLSNELIFTENFNLDNLDHILSLKTVISNLIYINISSYLDLDIFSLSDSDKKSIIDRQKQRDTNYSIIDDENYMFFQEFSVMIYSDILKNDLINFYNDNSNNTDIIDNTDNYISDFIENINEMYSDAQVSNNLIVNNRLLFNNGVIELDTYMIDSSYSNDIISNLHSDSDNRIFLNIKDASNNIDNSYIFTGITEKNIYHNMFINEEQKIIFHKYDVSVNTYAVNNNNLSLQETINNNINTNNYLLEISSNDIYNCFVNSNTNVYNVTSIIYENTSDYKIFLDTFVNNELDISSLNLYETNIEAISLNGISYDEIPYAYDISISKNYTHTFLIDLSNMLDKDFYSIKYPNIYFDSKFLSYQIIDFSYINDFSFYDICGNLEISLNSIIGYTLSGDKFLINSLISNVIIFKFKMFYNSVLYDISLDTFILDLTVPDLVPPTLSYESINIVNQNDSVQDNIQNLIEKLLENITFIDIEQNFNDISYSNINYKYTDYLSREIISNYNNDYSLLDIDLSEIGSRELVFGENNITNVNIYYTLRDNVNNVNTITRTLQVSKGINNNNKSNVCCYPKVYYKPIQDNYKLGSSNSASLRLSKLIINNIR